MTPYSDAQWRAIDALGRQVDADLKALDVRLTQGGEPTFVSASNAGAPEWTHAALGDEKRSLAARLLRRLHARFAPGGLMHAGQGKWYPGETLPRWSYGLYWRGDGVAIWHDAQWIAGEEADGSHGIDDARRLIGALASKLGVAPDGILPVYEDPWPALDDESRLPAGVDPLQRDLTNTVERARLARLLRQGLGTAAGFVLPLEAAGRGTAWRSGEWPLRRERLYLLPGDFPLGHRLPLNSLPVGDGVVRTALCVEARNGRLHVFAPPIDALDKYLALIAALEACARELALPVVPEGFEPPPDPSIAALRITPDPGVVEVNVHPAADWDALVCIAGTVYEEARALGLAAHKHLRDGRVTGTGGGSHITLGGTTPQDSPLLRRPDLLRSLIAYWQNHPALSYLFAGLYVGPTSQAPRVDEARENSLDELGIAFQQLDRLLESGAAEPETVDRLLRDLLVDVTGNAHRAEFCVDKLYSPDGPTGRLGLLEVRAFEMAPHERMAAVQCLLVRALVARFWKSPYRAPAVRWGRALHDRFMLPHCIEDDAREVLSDLAAAGYPFDAGWLKPFLDFRFPLCGAIAREGITLELRHAHEPWPVLGEATSSASASRPVDASLDRLEVRLRGTDGIRHAVLCNGRRVPLHPTREAGVRVGGVRFRARCYPRMLHPSIPVQSPLEFRIVETPGGRIIGACTYHSSDPSGRDDDRPPTDETEARKRRARRFVLHESEPGAPALAVPPPKPGSAYTLDLRVPPEASG